MKAALCFLLMVLVIAIEAFPQDGTSRVKRGFRNGASDRFSHGFGKRNEVNDEPISPIMSVGEMASLLRNNPKLAYIFVKQFMDKNGDGQVTADELFGMEL